MKNLASICLFGSIWGLLEATLGGVLHIAHVPFTGTVMASIGFALLFAAHRAGVRPAQLFLVSGVAASFKFFDALLFPIPLFDVMIINPATAIASQGLAVALVVRFSGLPKRPLALAPRMLAATAGGMLLFNGSSLGIMGYATHHTLHPWNAALVQLPLTTVGATLLSWGWNSCASHMRVSLTPRWQAATAGICAALAVGARVLL